MRKVSFVLVAVLLFLMIAGCGSNDGGKPIETSPAERTFSTVSEFLEVYKREDVSGLSSGFNGFAADLNKAVHLISMDDLSSGGWEKTFDLDMDEYIMEMYSLETVLFGKPATVSSMLNRYDASILNASLDVVIDTGKDVDDISLATGVCEKMFSKYGDAFYIYVSGEETSESELRKVWEAGVDFNCMWVIDADGENIGFSVGISDGGILVSCSFE